jgi:formylglycine-generating enzyme required for sulfatase activity/pimeloyl-ACP methyl ester carboxylesterase
MRIQHDSDSVVRPAAKRSPLGGLENWSCHDAGDLKAKMFLDERLIPFTGKVGVKSCALPWSAAVRLVSFTVPLVALALTTTVHAAPHSRHDERPGSGSSHRTRASADGTLRDCPECPEMVVVPAGHFLMGSSAAEKTWAAHHGVTMAAVADEAPQHEVSVASFAIGRYDVTRSEYAAFVRETRYPVGDGCGRDSFKWEEQSELTWEHPGFAQTDRDPVVCVSWRDAMAYIAWLNGKPRRSPSGSGDGPYRLPSESEWEYAARAGTSTRFWWGDDANATSQHAWYKGNSHGQTHRVGLKPPNAFGLYDIVGNVWQWTEDCYATTYSGAPTGGRAAERGVRDPRPGGTHECMRVDRGASWFFEPWALRSATRERNPADFRDAYMGFRVARTLRTAPANPAPGDEIYTRPGRLLDAGDGARLNVYCLGTGSPTVVFESGWSDWAPAWAVVQPRIARFTRACSYDRAGSGFSDPGPMPRTTERIATELHAALRSGGIAGPYILVGSAFGGDHVRAFADLFPQDVAGLVLVDADAGDVDTPENRKSDDDGNLSFVPRFRQCRDSIAAGNTGFALSPPPGRPAHQCVQGFFRGLPDTVWSDALNAKLIDIARRKIAMWDADISEMEQVPADEVWLQKHRRVLGRTPVRILTSGNHGVGHLDRPPAMSLEHLRYEYDRALAQSRWLTLSSDARQVFVTNSSEYIQFDQPNVLVDAVREVYDKTR